MKRQITEEMGLQDEWYKRAESLATPQKLHDFVKELSESYEHDYGTICHAVAAAAIGAAWTVERGPPGGITGFQAGAVMWEFITHWLSEYRGRPLRLLNFGDMLYPQSESKFDKTISPSTQEYLRGEATKLLAETDPAHVAPGIVEHWKSIAAGVVPFGYRVAVEESS